LELQQGKYFVGSTYGSVAIRFKNHKANVTCAGSAWMEKYPVVKLLYTQELDEWWEEILIVKYLMREFGIDNVRGGAYYMLNLTSEQCKRTRLSDEELAWGDNWIKRFYETCPRKRICSYYEEEKNAESLPTWTAICVVAVISVALAIIF
jgi:predicted PolB exonuclease-like 3'-5' exonuclease